MWRITVDAGEKGYYEIMHDLQPFCKVSAAILNAETRIDINTYGFLEITIRRNFWRMCDKL